jgi:aminoglycoside phosphotransferase (APT) family kinase protein
VIRLKNQAPPRILNQIMSDNDSPPPLHADEVPVSGALVQSLIEDQFPHWSRLPLQRMTSTGTDNAIFRLGPEMGVRLPRIERAVQQVGKELEWLPRLGPLLPVAVPTPLAKGEPVRGYPFPWLVYRWLDGEDLQHRHVPDSKRFGQDLAAFVAALESVTATDSPPAGQRGQSLLRVDEVTRATIRGLGKDIDGNRAMQVWQSALDAQPWPGPPVWVHGDLLPGNVLVHDGRLTGILDWSSAGVGDPACEGMLAWSLPPEARAAFRAALNFDAGTWARARGWVVQQAVLFIPYYAKTIPDAVAAARLRLQAALDEGS